MVAAKRIKFDRPKLSIKQISPSWFKGQAGKFTWFGVSREVVTLKYWDHMLAPRNRRGYFIVGKRVAAAMITAGAV
jgi:hypothetical protein